MENHKMTLMGVFVAAGLTLAWFLGLFDGVDPAVAEVEEYRDTKMKQVMSLPDEERRSVFQGLRERVEKLSDTQRKEFFESSRPFMQQMMINRARQLQEMTKEERDKELDKFIDRMEAHKENRGERNANRQNMTVAQIDQRRKQMLDRTTPQMRGAMDALKDMLNERRKERGMEPFDGPPFGRPPR